MVCGGRGSDGVVAGFAGADADRLFDGQDKDLAVADLSVRAAETMASTAASTRSSGSTISIFYLGREIDDIFRAAIEFGMAFCGQSP